MPKTVVEIEWDYPDEQYWLNADNIEIALSAYCKSTAFSVVELVTEDEQPKPFLPALLVVLGGMAIVNVYFYLRLQGKKNAVAFRAPVATPERPEEENPSVEFHKMRLEKPHFLSETNGKVKVVKIERSEPS